MADELHPTVIEASQLASALREQIGEVAASCLPEGWSPVILLAGPQGTAWSFDPSWSEEAIGRLLIAVGQKMVVRSKIHRPEAPPSAQN